MPDPTPTPAPEPTPHPKPAPLNAGQLDSLTKTEQICRVALQADYLSVLRTEPDPAAPTAPPEEEDITPEKIEALLAICEQTRNFSGEAAVATTGKRMKTQEEIDTAQALMVLIRFIQARARQKYFHTEPARLIDYGIGQAMEDSRALLEQYGQSLYDLTGLAKLPKVTAAKRAELKTALAAYKASETGQSSGQSHASQLRVSRDELLKETLAGRMQLQFAADAEWPATDPANYPIRKEFQLPANRPFVG